MTISEPFPTVYREAVETANQPDVLQITSLKRGVNDTQQMLTGDPTYRCASSQGITGVEPGPTAYTSAAVYPRMQLA